MVMIEILFSRGSPNYEPTVTLVEQIARSVELSDEIARASSCCTSRT